MHLFDAPPSWQEWPDRHFICFMYASFFLYGRNELRSLFLY